MSLTLMFAAADADSVAVNLAMKVLAVAGDRAAGPKASEIVAITSITAAAFSTSFRDTGKVGGTIFAKADNLACNMGATADGSPSGTFRVSQALISVGRPAAS